jgi:glyceraldehyde 3-phosphate dehydrogenase
MTVTIGINGFGRIGRNVVRALYAQGLEKTLKVVAINDLTDTKTLAHLFKYDSVHRQFSGEVHYDERSININGNAITITSEKDPANLPWAAMGVDIVLECTGIFRDKAKAGKHLSAGAKKVIVSAPSPDADSTIVCGVNNEAYKADHTLISNASCTTNCLAPVAKVLQDSFGIVRGTMTTIHSYTNDQQILDLPHEDLRRARAAGVSMIPTSTGAAKAVGLVLPALKGKVDGFAIRVPTPNVSLVDFVVDLEKETTKEELNKALKTASEGSLKGILGYCDEPLVSVDFVGNPLSSIVDADCTMVIQGKMAKVVAWYDNEMGYSSRMLDLTRLVAASM